MDLLLYAMGSNTKCVEHGSIGNFEAMTRWEYTKVGPKSKNLYGMLVPRWLGIPWYHVPPMIIFPSYQVFPH